MNFKNKRKLQEMKFNEMVERVENMNYSNHLENEIIVIEKLEDLIGKEFSFIYDSHYLRTGKVKVTNVEKIVTRTMTGQINEFQFSYDITDKKGQSGKIKLAEDLMEAVDRLNRNGGFIKLKK